MVIDNPRMEPWDVLIQALIVVRTKEEKEEKTDWKDMININ